MERTDYSWIVEHASINHPADLGGHMEWLWGQACDRNMPDAEIQGHLDVIAGWIETVERASPKGLWQDYK